MTNIERSQLAFEAPITYDLDDKSRQAVFMDSMDLLQGELKPDHTNVLIVPTDSLLANYVRAVEADTLPAIAEWAVGYEGVSRFALVLQDTEDGVVFDKPAHVFRINRVDERSVIDLSVKATGLPTFDDAIEQGLVTAQQLLDYYDVSSLPELGREYINVETNIAVAGVKPSMSKPYSALGYRAIFELVTQESVRGVVAYQNHVAMNSLARIGIIHTPLAGNPDISIAENGNKHLDDVSDDGRYYPLTIEGVPWSHMTGDTPEHNYKMFTDPDYAVRYSRLAALIARKTLNVINIV